MPTYRSSSAVASLIVIAALPARAQLPGLPTMQGAFIAPGLAVAGNVGHENDRTSVAGAVGYGTRRERFGLTAGVGTFTSALAGYEGSRTVYGVRAAVTVLRLADDRIAVTPFAGFGSTRPTAADTLAAGLGGRGVAVGKVVPLDRVPIGVAAGWRFPVGDTRAIALSVAPMYALARRTGGTESESVWRFRTAATADVALSTRLGLTFGTEFGQTAGDAEPGARGASFGASVSFAFGSR